MPISFCPERFFPPLITWLLSAKALRLFVRCAVKSFCEILLAAVIPPYLMSIFVFPLFAMVSGKRDSDRFT